MILHRYIFKSFFKQTLVSLSLLMILVLSIYTVKMIPFLGGIEPNWLNYLLLITTKLPNFLSFLLPIAFFSGIIYSCESLMIHNEMLAAQSLGISNVDIIKKSLFICAILFSFNQLLLTQTQPIINKTQQYLWSKIINENWLNKLKPGRFNQILGQEWAIYINESKAPYKNQSPLFIARKDPKQKNAWDIFLSEKSDVHPETEYDINLNNGHWYHINLNELNWTIMNFDKYQLNVQLPQITASDETILSEKSLKKWYEDRNKSDKDFRLFNWHASLSLMYIPLILFIFAWITMHKPRNKRMIGLAYIFSVYGGYMALMVTNFQLMKPGSIFMQLGMVPCHLIMLIIASSLILQYRTSK